MKKILPITAIIFSAFFTSCATVLSKKSYALTATTNINNAKIKVYDSIYNLPNEIKVTRSKKDLDLVLITDTLKLDFKVKSSPSPTFLYWNLIGMQASPLNYAIDFTNQKRFYYGKSVHLNANDTIRIIEPPVRKKWLSYFSEKHPKKKSDINLSFSVPYVNGFNSEPDGYGTIVNTGFWGISTGLEYFYKDNKYLGLKFAGATDFFVPIPAAVTLSEERENLRTAYVELTDNFKIGRLNIGYGLNYAINEWQFIDETDLNNTIEFEKRNLSFGITTNTYFQFSKLFFVGVIYRPTFYRIEPKTDFKYEHLISLDFAVKIPLKKK